MVIEYIAAFFLFGGFFFLAVGVIGLIRLPDVYTRMHALGKCDTLGAGLVLVGLMILVRDFTVIPKLFLIMALMVTINPVVTHLIAKTAYNKGTPMVEGSFVTNHYATSHHRRRESPMERKLSKEGGEN